MDEDSQPELHKCKVCGESKPSSEMAHRNGWCLKCVSENLHAAKRSKKTTIPEPIQHDNTPEQYLVIDFSNHRDILMTLVERAHELLRTPSNQVLWTLIQHYGLSTIDEE